MKKRADQTLWFDAGAMRHGTIEYEFGTIFVGSSAEEKRRRALKQMVPDYSFYPTAYCSYEVSSSDYFTRHERNNISVEFFWSDATKEWFEQSDFLKPSFYPSVRVEKQTVWRRNSHHHPALSDYVLELNDVLAAFVLEFASDDEAIMFKLRWMI